MRLAALLIRRERVSLKALIAGALCGAIAYTQSAQILTVFSVSGPVLVQQAQAGGVAGAPTVTITAPIAGDLLIGCIGIAGTSTPHATAVTGGGVTWAVVVTAGGASADIEIWAGPNSSGSGTSVTPTLTGTITDASMTVLEFSGVPASSPADGAGNSGSGVSTAPATGTAATILQGDIIMACHNRTASTVTAGPTNSFIALNDATAGTDVLTSAYLLPAAAAGYSTGWTLSGSTAWRAAIAAIKRR